MDDEEREEAIDRREDERLRGLTEEEWRAEEMTRVCNNLLKGGWVARKFIGNGRLKTGMGVVREARVVKDFFGFDA
ncbi:hypothetical protein TrCOL_g9362 [Triparma columacea]|uniref:Uncharacterized protein n=1 Tax=Triparma columacea TaxID=722753 RepID=A0A9W7G0C7_9STRA|nr:hypothetical protein TrCOL_g9362 [Triparma columacea]